MFKGGGEFGYDLDSLVAKNFFMVKLHNREFPILLDRKSTRLNSSHSQISYAVFCLKKKKNNILVSRQAFIHWLLPRGREDVSVSHGDERGGERPLLLLQPERDVANPRGLQRDTRVA